MPLPLLPALGLVAEFIAANGMRMATRRYGPEAVRKAMQEIGKRQAAINKRKVVQEARTAELKSPRSASSIEKQRLRALDKRLEKEQPRARFDEEGDLLPEIPLQFAQGDEVDAGIGSLVEEGRTMSDVDRMIAEQAARESISPVEQRIQMLQQTANDMGRTISDRDAQLFGMGEISFEEAMDRTRAAVDMGQVTMERNLMQQEQLGFAEGDEVSSNVLGQFSEELPLTNYIMSLSNPEQSELLRSLIGVSGVAVGSMESIPMLIKRLVLTGSLKSPEAQAEIKKSMDMQERKKMAEGGDVSRETNEIESALSEIENVQPEAQAVQQVMTMVMELVQSGASEEEIVAALRQMGLDDKDIEQVMMMLAEQMQGQQDPIQSELSQMM